MTMKSASIVDNATHLCSHGYQNHEATCFIQVYILTPSNLVNSHVENFYSRLI